MQIHPSLQGTSETVKDLPVSLKAMLAQGKQLEATVVAKVSADMARIRLGDSIIQIKTDLPLQPGQQISLQQDAKSGEMVIKILPASVAPADQVNALLDKLPQLVKGQQVVTEVIRLLAENRLLVKPLPAEHQPASRPVLDKTVLADILNQPGKAEDKAALIQKLLQLPQGNAQSPRTSAITASATQSLPTAQTAVQLPAQIEVDISALKQTFQIGDKLNLTVMQAQPLAVRISPAPLNMHQADLVQQLQQRLLPEINTPAPRLEQLNSLIARLADVPVLKQVASQLLQNVTEKTQLQQPTVLQAALRQSGAYLESQIRQQASAPTVASQTAIPSAVQADFKANLLKLAQSVQQQISDIGKLKPENYEKVYQSLPSEIKQALTQIVRSPEQMQKLPAQIQLLLAEKGQTPANLLLGLLSSFKTGSGASISVPTMPTTQPSNNGAVASQHVAREVLNQTSSTAPARVVDVQFLRDVLREVESLTSRIQYNQLSMVKDPDTPSGTNIWLFDLPVKERQQLEMMQMRIEQRQQNDNDDEAIWQVQLNLETVNLGKMQAQIVLHQQTVSVVFIAERQHSAQLLDQFVDQLQLRLEEQGFSVGNLSGRQAPVKDFNFPERVPSQPSSLLDISV